MRWLRLVRAPNIPTAVADVVAGGALAAVPLGSLDLWAPALGSAALYAGGVALNDVFDVRKDRTLHPERVLPSGLIRVRSAAIVAALLMVAGVASGFRQGALGVATAGGLAVAILVYDLLPDGAGVFGAVVLGICRALNILRGLLASQDTPRDFAIYVAIQFALIACVTVISLGEDRSGGPRLVRAALMILPLCYIGPVIAAYRRGHPALSVVVFLLCAELALWVVRPAYRGERNPSAPVPRAVFGLCFVGALYCLAVQEWIGAALLTAFFPLSRLIARAISQRGS